MYIRTGKNVSITSFFYLKGGGGASNFAPYIPTLDLNPSNSFYPSNIDIFICLRAGKKSG